jgi:hypothetical protein
MKKFKSEAELAAQIVAWFADKPYEIFQEVQYGRCGPVADIVARSGRIIWVIEAKMTLGLSVLGQADSWRPYAHYVSIATPTYAPAGNAESLRWTPWRQTCDNLKQAVQKRPGIPFKELVEGLDHHYATVANARASLRHWIAEGKIEGVRLERDGRYLRAYPAEEGKPSLLVHDRQIKFLHQVL